MTSSLSILEMHLFSISNTYAQGTEEAEHGGRFAGGELGVAGILSYRGGWREP